MAANPKSTAEVLPTHTPALFEVAVARASDALRAGEVVALPTETVYGLAANALDTTAVQRLYAIKGRPPHNPIIVHVASLEMARTCVAHWPESASRLAAAFWPGPLTIVLPRSPLIPDIVTAGGATVGLRWPSHPFIQSVIQRCGFPLAAPSANLSNQLSPTNAHHVRTGLGDRLNLIVDGGQSQVGIESTVVDLACQPFRVLRPGMIHLESLLASMANDETFASDIVATSESKTEPLRSPGQLEKHYSPRACLIILDWSNDAVLRAHLKSRGLQAADCHVIAHSLIPGVEGFAGVSVIPHDAEAYARAIYAELHRCDDAGARVIVAEAVPATADWKGIADRLQRAAASGR